MGNPHPNPENQFKKGHPGGPGRPKGSRSKLSEAFLKALSDDFTVNGLETVKKVRKDKPDSYLNVIAKLMPKLMELTGSDGEPLVHRVERVIVDPKNTDS